MEPVNYQVEDRIAILTIQNPPVNALGTAVQEGLGDTAGRAMHHGHVDAIVITGAGTTFTAGADIKQLARMAYEGVVWPILPQLFLYRRILKFRAAQGKLGTEPVTRVSSPSR